MLMASRGSLPPVVEAQEIVEVHGRRRVGADLDAEVVATAGRPGELRPSLDRRDLYRDPADRQHATPQQIREEAGATAARCQARR
jgi:hypothetical protein